MDTKRLREILIELGNVGIKGSLIPNDYYNGKIDQAIKEIQELCKPMSEAEIEKEISGHVSDLIKIAHCATDMDMSEVYKNAYSLLKTLPKKISEALVGKLSTPRLNHPCPFIEDKSVVCISDYICLDCDEHKSRFTKSEPSLMGECQCEKPLTDNYNSECFHCGKTLRDATCTGKKPSVRGEGQKTSENNKLM